MNIFHIFIRFLMSYFVSTYQVFWLFSKLSCLYLINMYIINILNIGFQLIQDTVACFCTMPVESFDKQKS